MYDISVSLNEELLHWPGEQGFSLSQFEKKANLMVSAIQCGAHTGTHIDAPYHFLNDGLRMHELELFRFYGLARVVSIQGDHITRSELEQIDLQGAARLLFSTRNSRSLWHTRPFDPEFCAISPDAAQYLVEKKILLAGVDYLSVEAYGSDGSVHRTLLGASIGIIEGLDLSRVPPGDYYLMALPLKIQNGDGTPARAILLEESELRFA
jgi:arylformamidase